jgi:hypothetical protein
MLAFRVAAAAPFVSGSKGAGGCGVLPPRGLALGASGVIVGQQICDFVGSGGVRSAWSCIVRGRTESLAG